MLRTTVVSDRRYARHFAGRAHPERPQRIEAVIQMAEGLRRDSLTFETPHPASADQIELCHSPEYVSLVRKTAEFEHYDFDLDTHGCRDSFDTAVLAAGGVLTAVESVLEGAADNSFALVRPPGHHALPERAMGFCFFNNIAIAAAYLTQVRGLKRVLIFDWDLHHGNGTQEIFYESPRVLYISMHQFPHYPGTGSLDEIGVDAGTGFTVNAPLPATLGDPEYLAVMDQMLLPIARQFNPEFILISAGFDCHFRDPLGAMRVTEAGFGAMTRRIKRLAAETCGGKIAGALEGGYDLQALAGSVRVVLEELGRDADEAITSVTGGERTLKLVDLARGNLSPYWSF